MRLLGQGGREQEGPVNMERAKKDARVCASGVCYISVDDLLMWQLLRLCIGNVCIMLVICICCV